MGTGGDHRSVMRVTTIGHAGLLIESGSTSILVDPWMFGSCYWRSWWHYPPSPEPQAAWLSPGYLYLTHHHFDHFHYPSLRRIDRNTRVLIPRFGVDVMRGELEGLGFHDVQEMDHDEVVELDAGLQAVSYQYGFDDSAFIVKDADACVYDLNDCKLRPHDLKALRGRFGRPDLLLKSHSWAQGFPNCYKAEDPQELGLLSRGQYVEDFLDSVRALEPKTAAPFASMVCFLHPETWARNGDIVTPVEVAEAFRARPVPGVELIVMNPGNRWDSAESFQQETTDYYTDRTTWYERLRAEAEPALARAAAAEAGRGVSFETFASYFESFLRALPPGLGWALRRPVVFRPGGSDDHWVIDWGRRQVTRASQPPPQTATVVEVPAAVLDAAIADHIVHFIHISMRLRVELRRGGLTTDLAFWALLGVWELGYLPLRALDWRRFLAVAWRRRSEVVGTATGILASRGQLSSSVTARFMTPPVAQEGPDVSPR